MALLKQRGSVVSACLARLSAAGERGVAVTRPVIFILGMGRSGTSVLSRLLSLCGGVLPEKLLVGAVHSNSKGHWEPQEALDLNERFLHAHASSWYDPAPLAPALLAPARPEAAALRSDIRALLRSWPTGSFLVVKEPRITALLAPWLDAARDEGRPIRVVVAVRHPDEVAMSLAARDGLPRAHAELLWLKYGLLAEQGSRGLPRVFVDYGRLLDAWRQQVDRIGVALGVDVFQPDVKAIEAFLSPDLHRQRLAPGAAPEFMLPAVRTLYGLFAAAAASEDALDVALLDRLHDEFAAAAMAWPIAISSFLETR